MERKIEIILKNLLSHLKYYDDLAPFPIYGSEYIKDVEDKLKEVMGDKDKNYDEEPVVACRFCKSLHIVSDEVDNNVCMRCGSINELTEFKDINEYLKFKNSKDE
jgi:hypothetical protein